MSDDRKCLGPPRCRYTSDEGVKQHEPGCPMLLPPPVVRPDPMRYRNPVAVVTGGALDGDHASGADRQEYEMLYGIPAAIGVEIPLTHRVGDYLAQPRNGETALGIGDIVGEMNVITRQHTDPLVAGTIARSREDAQAALGRIGIAPMTVVVLPRPDYQLTEDEAVLVKQLQAATNETEARKAIDRFMAGVYDRLIDDLAAKRRDHTRRLIK